MNPEKVNVFLPEGYKGHPVELVFREGSAAPIRDDYQKMEKVVSMSSLNQYVEGRSFSKDKKENTGILMYSLEKRRVSFETDPNDTRATVLSSYLEIHPDLDAFGINEDRKFSSKSLVKHITKYAHCFSVDSAAKNLISALRNHEVKFEQELKNLDDRQGNTQKSVKTALKFTEGMVDLNWTISVPLFKGQPLTELQIEVQIDAVDGAPVYSFWCLDLETILRTSSEAIINEVVDQFSQKFVCLEAL